MGLGFFWDFIANMLAGWIGELLTPTGMTGFVIALAVTVAWAISWHRRQRAAKKAGMASWTFIILVSLLAALAIGAAGYGLGLKYSDAKAPSASSTGTVERAEETHLHLQFGSGTATPVASELANIFRWYALATVVVIESTDGASHEIKSWSVFLTFDQPTVGGQIVVESKQPLPNYEVKDSSDRSAVIAFMGDLANIGMDIRFRAGTATPKAQPGPLTTNISPQTTSGDSKPIYTVAEIQEMLDALRQIRKIIDEDTRPQVEKTQEIYQQWPHLLMNDGPVAVAGRLEAIRDPVRKAATDLRQLMYKENHYNAELRPAVGDFESAYGWFDSATSMLIDALRKYASADKALLGDLLKDRYQEWAGGINGHVSQWFGKADAGIRDKTKELREWPHP